VNYQEEVARSSRRWPEWERRLAHVWTENRAVVTGRGVQRRDRELERVLELECPEHAGQDRRCVGDQQPAPGALGVGGGGEEHAHAREVDEPQVAEIADQDL
jgi:hypothetical protein